MVPQWRRVRQIRRDRTIGPPRAGSTLTRWLPAAPRPPPRDHHPIRPPRACRLGAATRKIVPLGHGAKPGCNVISIFWKGFYG